MACWYVHIQTYDCRPIFLLGASFLLTDAGAICSDKDNIVDDVDECRRQVPFIKTIYPGAVYSQSYSCVLVVFILTYLKLNWVGIKYS